MSSLPPEEPPTRKRRTWLWVLIGVIGALVLCCCAFSIWAGTAGEARVDRWFNTEIPRWLTETAGTREAR
jgi:hypothetical protein